MVLLILGCFTICWLPYFIVACLQIYDITKDSSVAAYMAAFTLAMSNSAMNPLIYAWKNSNFRHAFTNLLKCKSPDTLEPSQSMRSNLHRKSSSAQHQDTLSGAFPNYSTPPFMKKIEPITAMGITFEEDEDRISACESSATMTTTKQKQLLTTSPPASVTIKIESDTTRNSIIISTTTLPQQEKHLQHADGSAPPDESLDVNRNIPLEQSRVNETDNRASTMRSTSGNLIVNKLIENYGYDIKEYDYDGGRYRENYLNVNTDNSLSSKRKSKSANSILVTKYTNKSNSHGSIYDNSLTKYNNNINNNNNHNNLKNCNEINIQSSNGNIGNTNNVSSNNIYSNSNNKTHNLLPSFHFGKKYISKSFNSAVEGLDKCNTISSDKICRKSTELHFPV